MHYVVKMGGQYGYLFSGEPREQLRARLEAAGGKLMAKKPSERLAIQAAENLQHAENVRAGTRTLGGARKTPLGIASITVDASGSIISADFTAPKGE